MTDLQCSVVIKSLHGTSYVYGLTSKLSQFICNSYGTISTVLEVHENILAS